MKLKPVKRKDEENGNDTKINSNNVSFITGMRWQEMIEQSEWWKKGLDNNWGRRPEEAPPPATFKKSNPEVPRLDDYKKEFSPEFWNAIVGYDLPEKHENWINGGKLKEEAKKAKYKSRKLDITIDMLENGINIGIETEEARMATDRGENYEAVYEFGEEFTDALVTWLKDEIVAGPFTKEELKRRGFEEMKVIPVTVRPKPNGKLRIILDLSFPHLKESQRKPGVPTSVNDGIPKEKFPAKMATTKDILERLATVGRRCEFTKIDWKAAYKHFGVRREDWKMQIIEWGGRYFIELRAAFGTRSSPYYFDVGSDVIKELTAKNVKVNKKFAPKCLDDIIPMGTEGSGKVRKFADEYVRICKETGIRLAEESDGPGKCFGIARKGEVLGIDYDLEKWTWQIPRAKSLRLENEIWDATQRGEITQEKLERIIGKVTHYGPLIPGGKWQRSWLLAHDRTQGGTRKADLSQVLKLSEGAIWQLKWWQAALRSCENGAPIPDIRGWARVDGITLHSDAAGGGPGAGFGGVGVACPGETSMAWTQETWPEWLNKGEKSRAGVKMNQKLSTLEGFAALAMLAGVAKEAQGHTVYLHVDNAGFIYGYEAGNSRCLYVASVAKALFDLGEGK